VLAVVQHEQQASALQRHGEAVQHGGARFAHPNGLRNSGQDQRGIFQGRQSHEYNSIGKEVGQPGGHLHGQARLA
jgi:hypothetical protein